MRFKHLYVPDHWEHYWSQYPNGFTILEALISWVSQVNKMIDNQNELIEDIEDFRKEIDEFVKQFDKNLEDKLRYVLNEWLESGKLTHELIDVLFPTHTYTYASVAEMQDQEGLIIGSKLRTLGYYEIGDGGGAYYTITDIAEEQHIKIGGLYAKNISPLKNIVMYGADKFGLKDSLHSFINALKDADVVVVPIGEFIVSDSIRVLGGKYLKGATRNIRNLGNTATIKYVGEENRYKSVLLLGRNDVNSVPTISNSNVAVENLRIDCNDLAGFGVYGTYISGESKVMNVCAENSLEYAMYFARSWYLKLVDLVSLRAHYNGIALGMPLRYSDGRCISEIEWDISTELNLVKIDNIRSSRAGMIYEHKEWNKGNITDLLGGYGVGVGVGNGIIATNIVSESSGGANLINYTRSQPNKVIEKFYIERTNIFSNLPNNEKIGLLNYFGKNGHTGGSVYVRDGFINPTNGGNITLSGVSGRNIYLENIQQPAPTTTYNYDISEEMHPLYYVRGRDLYNHYYNYNPGDIIPVTQKIINTGGQWENIYLPPMNDALGLYIRKVRADVEPVDFISYYDRNDNRVDIDLTRLELTTDFKMVTRISRGTTRLFRGGSTSTDTSEDIEILVVKTLGTS